MTTPKRCNILIVDDSATMRSMIKRVLRMTHLPITDVCEAANGRLGLDTMQSRPVDLVLADLNMPEMDGAEMIRRMFQDPALREIPVFIISAQPDMTLVDELKQCGVRGYLPKPFTPESMRDMLMPILGSKLGDAHAHA